MINKRLSKLSSNDKIFNSIKKDYDDALTTSGHDRLKGYDKPNLDYNSKKQEDQEKLYILTPHFVTLSRQK